jgi:phosphate starvation-inducible PhoH-like protein
MSKKHIKKQAPQNKQLKREGSFHLEFLNAEQKAAYEIYLKNDIIFLLGPAGSGKSYLATGFAVSSLLTREKTNLILTRPMVEATATIGFLPGSFEEKISPYLIPMVSCFDDLVGKNGLQRDMLNESLQTIPLGFLRGVTFKNCVAILDEAQNATYAQIKLYLTRIGINSKIIITGDASQSDIGSQSGLMDVVDRLKGTKGIGIVTFTENAIVRHPLIPEILRKI